MTLFLVGTVLFAFAGLSASALWGFFGVFGVLTAGLYVLKLRRRQRLVAFLGLWEPLLLERKASAWRSKLQRFLSLLLSLALVAALVLSLGDPRVEDEEKLGRSIVVLLDVSASMGKAEGKGKGTRFDVARERVRGWFASLGPGDQILLVGMGARPRPLEAFTDDTALLSDALERSHVLDVTADLDAALRLGRDALRGRTQPQIIVVSDGALHLSKGEVQGGDVPVFFESVTEEKDEELSNVAVTAFSARRYPASADRFEVLIELENAGEEAAVVELSLFEAAEDGSRGPLLDVHEVRLAPNSRSSQSYENLDHAEEGLIAEVVRVDGKSDSFPPDNIARTLLSPRQPVRVLVVGSPNTFLEAALLVDDSLEVQRVSAEKYPPAGEFDVTIFDQAFPKRVSRTGAAFYLGVPAEETKNFPIALGRELSMFGFDTWKKDSTIFRLVDPYNIQVLKGQELVPEDEDTVLAASAGKPILLKGKRTEGTFLALGFSPRDSDFVLRAVWPLFVVNILDELFPRGRGAALLGFKTGEVWRPPAGNDVSRAEIRGPLGVGHESTSIFVPVEDGRAVLFGQEAGFFDLITESGTTRFAASILSANESREKSNQEFIVNGAPVKKVSGMEPRNSSDPWLWLMMGVFAVSFLEWWSFHRRWTV